MTHAPSADIAVIGGSGFYSLLPGIAEVRLESEYGEPSDAVVIAQVAGRHVAFLPRHGRTHAIPPHRINYRANIDVLAKLGVRYLVSPFAAGSLQAAIQPGDFVVCDQYVDRTSGRADTFFDGPQVVHTSAAYPYCPVLRRLALESIEKCGVPAHPAGTVVVVSGPRFSTAAESRWYTSQGWDVVNMTQYPEAQLALERNIAVTGIALVTDRDVGVVAEHGGTPVTHAEVLAVMAHNANKIREVVLDLVKRIPPDLDSPQHHAVEPAPV